MLIAIAGAAPDVLSPHLSLHARLNSWTHNIWFLIGAIPVFYLLARKFAGERWLTFLDAHGGDGAFSAGAGRALASAPYGAGGPVDEEALLALCEHWIRANV